MHCNMHCSECEDRKPEDPRGERLQFGIVCRIDPEISLEQQRRNQQNTGEEGSKGTRRLSRISLLPCD